MDEQLEVKFDLMRGIRYCVNIVSSFPQKSSIPFAPTLIGQPIFIHSSFASANSPLLTNSSDLHRIWHTSSLLLSKYDLILADSVVNACKIIRQLSMGHVLISCRAFPLEMARPPQGIIISPGGGGGGGVMGCGGGGETVFRADGVGD